MPFTDSNTTSLVISREGTATLVDLPQQMRAEHAATTVYSSMKLLENKYIDLANFYKYLSEQNNGGYQSPMAARRTPPAQISQQDKTLRENALIQSLLHVKNELESQMGEK